MAARTIDRPRDRLITILIAPLMTCSARLPVYTLIIAAFVPDHDLPIGLGFGVGLQGLVLFGLYALGLLSGLAVALAVKWLMGEDEGQRWFVMELPPYRLPRLHNLAIGLLERGKVFLRRAGTTIFLLMILVWAAASYPTPPEDADRPAIAYSLAGQLGEALAPAFAPLGFNWQMTVALIPGMAAREVAVAALGTVYALDNTGDEAAVESSLRERLQTHWSLPSALAFLVWYIFAPQCLSTLAVARRETGHWRWPLLMFSYLMALAWLAAAATYQLARLW
jgi:ferrous iron transport protein B